MVWSPLFGLGFLPITYGFGYGTLVSNGFGLIGKFKYIGDVARKLET